MKILRIANGVRHLEEANANIMLHRIREVLTEHRSNLITGILSDLPIYIQVKFYANLDQYTRENITRNLIEFASTNVSMKRYAEIVRTIEQSASYRVPTSEFFDEIDAFLEGLLNPVQLQLNLNV